MKTLALGQGFTRSGTWGGLCCASGHHSCASPGGSDSHNPHPWGSCILTALTSRGCPAPCQEPPVSPVSPPRGQVFAKIRLFFRSTLSPGPMTFRAALFTLPIRSHPPPLHATPSCGPLFSLPLFQPHWKEGTAGGHLSRAAPFILENGYSVTRLNLPIPSFPRIHSSSSAKALSLLSAGPSLSQSPLALYLWTLGRGVSICWPLIMGNEYHDLAEAFLSAF